MVGTHDTFCGLRHSNPGPPWRYTSHGSWDFFGSFGDDGE
jgi:hypothetical protein